MSEQVAINSTEFWVKIVGMLQQNWALLEARLDGSAQIVFIHDTSGVFDEMSFASLDTARDALSRNGFEEFATSPNLKSFLSPPSPPFHRTTHPNGPIYSSGRFWRS